MSGIDPIYEEHDPDDLPPELQPLPGLSWDALSNRAVHRLVASVPEEELADVPGSNLVARGVLATGTGVWSDDEVVPTLAGLLVFGRRPDEIVPGMRAIVTEDGVETETWSGSARVLAGRIGRDSAVGRSVGASAARLLTAHALAWRSWEADHIEEPVRFELTEGRLSVSYPGRIAREVTNPVLAELLWRTRLVADTTTSLDVVRESMRGTATQMSVRRSADTTTLLFSLDSEPTPPQPARPDPAEQVGAAREETSSHRSAADRQAELVHFLVQHGQQSRRMLQERLGWSRSTLRDVLRTAVETGVVIALAPSPRSPFQVYQAAFSRRGHHPRPPARTRTR